MTTQKNGTTIPTNGKAVATTTTLQVVKKDETPPAPAAPLSAFEDRMLKISQLFELQQKHTRLIKSLQKLDEFQLKKGEENIRITIDDENNSKVEEFTTSNPDVVAETLAFVRATIIDRKKKIESLLVI